MYKYVFGPVPSRRLGISLGIDLVKDKRCNFNCVYCECGATKEYTEERKQYVDLDQLKKEIDQVLKKVTPDYITFSGSGEPTLNSDLGAISKWIKSNYKIKTALITNSSLFYKEEVVEESLEFDLIIPTLNAITEDVFQKINRSSKECSIEKIKLGLQKLSKKYNGDIYVEFFVIEGINDTEDELKKYVEYLKTIKYTKLQLNSLARKGAEDWVKPVSKFHLEKIKKYFEENKIFNVEIIGECSEEQNKIELDKNLIKNMLEKRDYTEQELEKIYKK
ncbi:MAG: radical SAM protein [Fusobacteriaceae bacterium]